MTFDTVIYRNSEDEKELVNAEEIALRSDYEVIKKICTVLLKDVLLGLNMFPKVK